MEETSTYTLAAAGAAGTATMPLHFLEHRALAGAGASSFASFSGYWKQGTVSASALAGGDAAPATTTTTSSAGAAASDESACATTAAAKADTVLHAAAAEAGTASANGVHASAKAAEAGALSHAAQERAPQPVAHNRADMGAFTLTAPDGTVLPVQTFPAAYWPDGSLKWTFHTADFGAAAKPHTSPVVEYGREPVPLPAAVTCKDAGDRLVIDTGAVQTELFTTPNADGAFIGKTVILGRTAIASGRLVYVNETPADGTGTLDALSSDVLSPAVREVYYGRVESAAVEEQGDFQVVVALRGTHVNAAGAAFMPFVLRLTLRLNDPFIRIQHTFTYTGDPNRDFMRGLGMELKTPLFGREYNRHILFAGELTDAARCTSSALFHEEYKLLQSWHPKIAPDIYPAQLAGKPLVFNPTDAESRAIDKIVASVPGWASYRLFADSADHWRITKSTGKRGCTRISAAEGRRTTGAAALCGEDGGIVVCQRDFWQKYPSSLWFDNIAASGTSGEDTARTTVWFWSPEAPAKDFRHYDTEGHAGSYYEGYDKLGGDPYGIANTNEVLLGGFLPHDGRLALSHEELDAIARDAQKPALLVSTPQYYHDTGAFGIWSLPRIDGNDAEQRLEAQLDAAISFYKNEVEQRRWYGFFDYGDVMHTYDRDRHCWRYDMGGYAWQNTELVPTLWLWYSFLRTGREDILTLSEAMSRHTSEVDIYHEGKYKGLGSRHNVIHWGCPCKEARIAMAGHHRFAYYLTGDRRFADIFDIVKDADFATLLTDPLAMFYDKAQMKLPTHARTGPDWSTYTSNWLTEWERHGSAAERYAQKLRTGIADLKQAPLRLVSGSNFEYDPATGHLGYIGENASGGFHLAICMGGPQTWFELVPLLADPEWEQMLADFGVFYFASPEEQKRLSHGLIGKRFSSLPFLASAMGAFGARYYKNAALARTVWDVLLHAANDGDAKGGCFTPQPVAHCSSAAPIAEIPWVSTNTTAQFCLNAIVCLELIGAELPPQ